MSKKEKKEARSVELSKALAHPLRVRILAELEEGGQSSPNQLSQQLQEPLGNVSYHVKTLLEFECIELTKTEPRRGAVEHYYRSTGAAQLPGRCLSPVQRQLVAVVVGAELANGAGEKFTPVQLAELADACEVLEKESAAA